MSPGVLRLPNSQRRKIESEYSTEDQKRNAAVEFWLAFDPCASWRRLVRQLDWLEEYAVAKRIHHYAEKVPGMICIHVHWLKALVLNTCSIVTVIESILCGYIKVARM